MAVTDEALYRRYLDGDESGLDRLVEKYGDPLTLYIDGYLHDIHEAEERMMDVFAYLFVKRPGIRDGGLKAYLYKAAAQGGVQPGGRGQRAGRPGAGGGGRGKAGAGPGPAPVHGGAAGGVQGGAVSDVFRGHELRPGGGGHGEEREAGHQSGVPGEGAPAGTAGTGGDNGC